MIKSYIITRLIALIVALMIDMVDMIYTRRFETFYMTSLYIISHMLYLVGIGIVALSVIYIVNMLFSFFFKPKATQSTSQSITESSTSARTEYIYETSVHMSVHVLIIIFALLRLIYISYNTISFVFNLFVLVFYLYQLIAHILSIADVPIPRFMKAQHGFECLYLIAASFVFMNVTHDYSTVLFSKGILFPRHFIFFEMFEFCADVIFSLYGIYLSTDRYFLGLPDFIANIPIGLMYISYVFYVYEFKIISFIMIFVAAFVAQYNFYPYLPKPQNETIGYNLNILSIKEKQDRNIKLNPTINEINYESK